MYEKATRYNDKLYKCAAISLIKSQSHCILLYRKQSSFITHTQKSSSHTKILAHTKKYKIQHRLNLHDINNQVQVFKHHVLKVH